MSWLADHLLTIAVFLPLAGAAVIAFLNPSRAREIRWIALVGSLLTFVVTVVLYASLRADTPGMQLTEIYPWINAPPINYHLGVDGLSALLILLTGFLTPLAVLVSWTSITQRVKGFFALLLALETGLIGVFASLDLVLFFVFWEVMLIPMYFLIGVWGYERRVYAAVKFILYTMVGSALMLVGILYLYSATGTFDLVRLVETLTNTPSLSPSAERWLFLAFFVAFAIKVPLFPFHTWLPDAHVEAPTAGSVILAGVLLKMGTYGMLRFCLPLFPHASRQFAPIVIVLAIIGIIYGALVAMVQPDLKKLVAYSSVAHLGFCVLGIFVLNVQGIEGSIYQMLSHGVSTGALFILVGLLYERRHTRLISDFGGLATSLPLYSTFFLIVALSSLGLPMLNGFVGEFLIIIGSYHSRALYAGLAALGVVLAAVYLLWMYQRVFYGETRDEKNRNLPDCNLREKLMLASVVVVILAMGVYPQPFLRHLDQSAGAILSRVEGTENRGQGLGNREQGIGNSRRRADVASWHLRAGSRKLEGGAAFLVPHSLFPVPLEPEAAGLSPHTAYDIPHTLLRPVPYSLSPVPCSLSPVPSAGGGR